MFEKILFLTIYSALPFFWLLMLRFAGIQLLRISIPSILMITIFIFQYIGFPILFFEWNSYRAIKINDQSIIWETFAWSSFTITLLIVGFVFSRKIFGPIHGKQSYSIYGFSIRPSFFLERVSTNFLLIISIIILIFFISKIGFSNLAITKVLFKELGLESNNLSTSALRSDMGNNFSGKYHWYRLFMRDLLQIATVAIFSQYLLTRRFYHLLFFLITFLITSFSVIISTEKAPLFWFLLNLLMTYCIVCRSGYVPKKYLLLGLPAALVFIGIIYVYFMNSSGLIIGINSGLSRVLMGQIQGLYHYLNIFPEKVDYLLGRSFPNPGGLFPWETYRLTIEVNNIVYPEFKKQGIVGSMPTFFWGEMYANFGYLGIIIPPFFIGVFLYWFNLQLFRLSMSPLIIAFFLWFVIHFQSLALSGLSKFIININGVIILFILLSLLFVIGRGVFKYRRAKYFE